MNPISHTRTCDERLCECQHAKIMCTYDTNDATDLSKVFVNQDVYHLPCYFNYTIINHLEYWNVYSWLITSFPNNVNKIQGEKVLKMHSFNLQTFTEYLHAWRRKPSSDKEGAALRTGS